MEAFIESFSSLDSEQDQNLAEGRLSYRNREQKGFTSKPFLTFAEPIVQACQDVAVFTV